MRSADIRVTCVNLLLPLGMLILVGHVLSEQGGMILCADWLRSFIPEVPVAYLPTPEPFWNPGHPVKTSSL
jgi:hypothetical protein